MELFGKLQAGRAVTCLVTNGVVVFRQLGMWDAPERVYLFVPSGLYGYVVFCRGDFPLGENIIHAFAIKRPRALETSWHERHTVRMGKMSLEFGDTLYVANKERYKVLA